MVSRAADPPLHFSTPGVSLAVVTVTAAGLIGGLGAPGPPGSSQAAVLVALAVVHVLFGTVGIYLVERRGTRAQLHAHFAAALAVGAAAVVVSHGYAFLLVLSLISQSVLYLPAPGSIGVTVGCAVAAAAAYATSETSAFHDTSQLIGLASAVPFVVAFSHLLVRQRRAQAEVERLAADLGEANERLRTHASDVEELATTVERNRIAREIHDGLGHCLTVVHVQLDAAQAMLERDPAGARRSLARAQELTHEGLDEVRRSVSVLRGSTRGVTPAASLIEAIEKLASECTGDGLTTRVELAGTPRALADSIVFTLYRATQEALTNVRRHARASNICIELGFLDPQVVRLRIADDGVGAGAPHGGFGLIGLRERAELCGGAVTVSAAPGQGFTLELELPG